MQDATREDMPRTSATQQDTERDLIDSRNSGGSHTPPRRRKMCGDSNPLCELMPLKKTNKNFIVFSDTQQVALLYEVELLCIVSYGKFPSAIKDTE